MSQVATNKSTPATALVHALFGPIIATTGELTFDPAQIFPKFRKRNLAKNEPYLLPGETCRNLYFLESGLLRHTRTTGETTLTRWATLPGQYGLSLNSFINQVPAEEGIEAAEESVVLELDHQVWAQLRAEHAQLQQFWVATLEYTLCCFEDRVWSLISGDGEQRYRYMIERYPEFLLALPQYFVADMLGIAPRHLSRIRNKVRKN